MTHKMTISIALAVYNGATYLDDQLNSYLSQSRLPDELVVCDDHSTDDTNEIIVRFAETAPFPVRIFRNEQNLGSIATFERAISECRGDLIFPSDQDDVWMLRKLERMAEEFGSDPDLGLVFANAGLVDKDLRSLRASLFDKRHCRDIERRISEGKLAEKIVVENVVSGAVCGFRAKVRELFLPFPTGLTLLHDGWLGLMAAATGKVLFLRDELNLYRQHDSQQVGARGYDPARGVEDRSRRCVITANSLLNKERDAQFVLSRLQELMKRDTTNPYLAQAVASVENCLQEFPLAADHFRRRASLDGSGRRRLAKIWAEAASGGYHRFSNGSRSILRDLFFQ